MIWCKSGPDQWMSRCSRYTIAREVPGRYVLRDGWGNKIQTCSNLPNAKSFAQAHVEGRVHSDVDWGE